MRIALLVTAFVAVLVLGFFLFHEELDRWVASDEGLLWLRDQGAFAGLAGAGLIASDVLLPMPGSGVMAALGVIYGGWVGSLYSLLGSLLGGLVGYGAVRALGRRAAHVLAGERELARLRRFFERRGAWAIVLTRAVPVVPEVLACLAGLAPMPFRRFALALLCGSLPQSFALAYFGAHGADEPATTMAIAVAVPALLFFPAWWATTRGGEEEGA
ncbi:MAG: VTT domain-containing protein [Planctomycetota bacterium]